MDGETGGGSLERGPLWRTITLIAMAILGVATLVALVITVRDASLERDRAFRAQARSYGVMVAARTLAGTIARSEASLGRYVISVDRGKGQGYYNEWRFASAQLERLDRLVHRASGQQVLMDRLRRAFRERGAELSLIALSITYNKNPQALALYYRASKAPSRRTIERTLDEIILAERALLDRRTAETSRLVSRSSTAAIALSLFGGLLVVGAILLGWLTVRALGEGAVARAEADAAEARATELAAAVQAATDELRVQEAKLRQAQKMDAVGQLTGGIAHDFNNMLAVVVGGIELARRNLLNGTAQVHLDSALDGANRAAALTRRLLAFAREEALKPEPIDPGALVSGMSELLDRVLDDAITVAVRDHAKGWRVHADRVQLENALLNLAVNARDAMNGRGALTITTSAVTLTPGQVGHSAGGDHVAFAVADTGSGMAPDVVERVFEPFFTTKPVGKGTGLGLSQIFGFVRQQGGEIGIDTAPGRGTTVTLYLPRHLGVQDAERLADRAPEPAGLPTLLHVLVVEDDPRVLAATIGALEELGHVALPCDDPLAAAGLLEEHGDVDLVISDVLMPRRTGPEMVADLLPRFPHLAILYVTGFAGDAGGAAEFGGHHVLRKPFTLAGLDRAVRTALADRGGYIEQLAAE